MKHCLVSIYICFFQQFSHLYWSSEQPKKETGLTGVSHHQHFVASLIYPLPMQNNLHPFVQCIKSFSIFVSLASVISHSLSFALCKCNYTSVCFQCHIFCLICLFTFMYLAFGLKTTAHMGALTLSLGSAFQFSFQYKYQCFYFQGTSHLVLFFFLIYFVFFT